MKVVGYKHSLLISLNIILNISVYIILCFIVNWDTILLKSFDLILVGLVWFLLLPINNNTWNKIFKPCIKCFAEDYSIPNLQSFKTNSYLTAISTQQTPTTYKQHSGETLSIENFNTIPDTSPVGVDENYTPRFSHRRSHTLFTAPSNNTIALNLWFNDTDYDNAISKPKHTKGIRSITPQNHRWPCDINMVVTQSKHQNNSSSSDNTNVSNEDRDFNPAKSPSYHSRNGASTAVIPKISGLDILIQLSKENLEHSFEPNNENNDTTVGDSIVFNTDIKNSIE